MSEINITCLVSDGAGGIKEMNVSFSSYGATILRIAELLGLSVHSYSFTLERALTSGGRESLELSPVSFLVRDVIKDEQILVRVRDGKDDIPFDLATTKLRVEPIAVEVQEDELSQHDLDDIAIEVIA